MLKTTKLYGLYLYLYKMHLCLLLSESVFTVLINSLETVPNLSVIRNC